MKNFLVICILFSSLSLYSQSVKIIKDSVCIDGKYYELQELTITKQRCFFTIQRAFDIFDGARFQDYEYRLYYKKRRFWNAVPCRGWNAALLNAYKK